MRELVIAADDRTGALEVAGECAARDGLPVLVVPFDTPVPAAARRVVVDLASRHLPPDVAGDRAARIGGLPAARHALKIDSGLRGNWAAEAAARLATATTPAVVVAALPAVGRTCRDGVVGTEVDGRFVPVAEALAADGRGAPVSSRPADHLAAVGVAADAVSPSTLARWLGGAGPRDVAVCDVATAAELDAVGAIARRHAVAVIGTAAAVGAWHAPRTLTARWSIPPSSVLVVCGSLAGAAREQLDVLARSDVPVVGVVLSPDEPARPISDATAEAMAARVAADAAAMIARHDPGVVVVLGGDTTAAVLGATPMLVAGRATPGTAVSRRADGRGPWFVTRSGSFGPPTQLRDLVASLVAGSAPRTAG